MGLLEDKIIVNLDELDKYLNKIDTIFPIKALVDKKVDLRKIKKYYRDSNSGYKYLHSNEGAVHMAINYDGIFNNEGFYTQVKEINEIIINSDCRSILELGSGKGFNSFYLAQNNPQKKFIGIDITNEHLLIANEKASDIDNLDFAFGDFHDLEFHDSSFDLIFELESICHAIDPKKVLGEIYRVLKDGGQFVLYEGFKEPDFESLPSNLKQAALITEKSMAVNNFERIDIWLGYANEIGFKLKLKVELSDGIMANLGRFQVLARGYFKYPILSRLFLRLLPDDMVMNSIAGLLMPFTVYNNAHGYYKIVLEK